MLNMTSSGPRKSLRCFMSSWLGVQAEGFGTRGRSVMAPLLNGLSSIPAFARMASVSDLHKTI